MNIPKCIIIYFLLVIFVNKGNIKIPNIAPNGTMAFNREILVTSLNEVLQFCLIKVIDVAEIIVIEYPLMTYPRHKVKPTQTALQ